MSKRRIVILGAGISGLSLGWYLKKIHGDQIALTIIEKEGEAGGWIRSTVQDGFLYEQGPRGCRPQGPGSETLSLIYQLGLKDQLIAANPKARNRYLWLGHRLQRFPNSLGSLFFSPLGRRLCRGIVHDWRTPSLQEPREESIREFFVRRFGESFAETFVEPMMLGIFAGDYRKLSLKACFPLLQSLEETYGSVVKGLIRRKRGRNATPSLEHEMRKKLGRAPLFSLKEGMQALPRALARELQADILFNTSALGLKSVQEKVEVQLSENVIEADHVFSTLPAASLSRLVASHSQQMADLFNSIPTNSVDVISMGFEEDVLPASGFGFLVPSSENEEILGMVWDSCVFPQQNQRLGETRLTVMIGGKNGKAGDDRSLEESKKIALKSLSRFLKVTANPVSICVKRNSQAIPQYQIGHLELVNTLEGLTRSVLPQLTFLGNSFYGVSVNDCIAKAKSIADKF